MKSVSIRSCAPALAALFAIGTASSASAQATGQGLPASQIDVRGAVPYDLSDMVDGPDIEGTITARGPDTMQISNRDGLRVTIYISEGTRIRARGGFLGMGRTTLDRTALLNGLPVDIETVQWGSRLIARRVSFSNEDLELATMIHSGTAQSFAEQTAATDALRGRVASIDEYNIVGTTNVYFDVNRWNLSPEAQRDLCAAASQASQTDNALLLVVGYTDSTGDHDYNQQLSERRAGGVVNFLQQQCDWAPWRMLTPTGMSESDPLADNATEEGRAQNRRVSVNILVSKAVEGF